MLLTAEHWSREFPASRFSPSTELSRGWGKLDGGLDSWAFLSVRLCRDPCVDVEDHLWTLVPSTLWILGIELRSSSLASDVFTHELLEQQLWIIIVQGGCWFKSRGGEVRVVCGRTVLGKSGLDNYIFLYVDVDVWCQRSVGDFLNHSLPCFFEKDFPVNLTLMS